MPPLPLRLSIAAEIVGHILRLDPCRTMTPQRLADIDYALALADEVIAVDAENPPSYPVQDMPDPPERYH